MFTRVFDKQHKDSSVKFIKPQNGRETFGNIFRPLMQKRSFITMND
jgi:hypothetical protein